MNTEGKFSKYVRRAKEIITGKDKHYKVFDRFADTIEELTEDGTFENAKNGKHLYCEKGDASIVFVLYDNEPPFTINKKSYHMISKGLPPGMSIKVDEDDLGGGWA